MFDYSIRVYQYTQILIGFANILFKGFSTFLLRQGLCSSTIYDILYAIAP